MLSGQYQLASKLRPVKRLGAIGMQNINWVKKYTTKEKCTIYSKLNSLTMEDFICFSKRKIKKHNVKKIN